MLTPIELQNKSFKSGGLGYDKKDVDQFFREVNDNYLRLYSENIDLRDRVAALNDALQQYKTMEKTLQRALVLAEKTAEDTKAAAIKNARTIEKEAQTKSQIIMADARNELERIHSQTLDMLKQFEKYKAQFKSLAAAQIELLDSESYSINAAKLDAFIDTSRTALPETRVPDRISASLPAAGREAELRSRSDASHADSDFPYAKPGASYTEANMQYSKSDLPHEELNLPYTKSNPPYTDSNAPYSGPNAPHADSNTFSSNSGAEEDTAEYDFTFESL